MAKNERTGAKVASKAAATLRDGAASKTSKSLAGSALSQARTKKISSSESASLASKALNSKGSSKTTKSLAGSVLTQRAGDPFPVKSFAIIGSTLSKAERSAAVRKVAKKKKK